MEPLRVRLDRFVLGLRGLALLRGWPYGDPEEADAQIAAMKELLAESDPDVIDIGNLDLARAYAAWSETYDGPNPLIQAEEPVVLSFVRDIPPGRALDVACGTGRLTGLLADAGHDVVGLDASSEMLSRARAKELSAAFVRGDARHLPFADAVADMVVACLALTHVADLREPVSEMARVVRPGGSVVLSDIHPLAVATGAHAFFEAGDGSRGVTRNELHWPSAYIDAFIRADLEVRACAEVPYEAEYAYEITDPDVRDAALASFPGLPFAIVWLLRRV
jgi:ubiquinone/menaquinone biosynthesis C-methylase UbiE